MAPRAATFRRNVILLVTAACIARVGIWAVSWRTVASLNEASFQVQHAQKILGALESVRSGLESVVALERGYLITGRPSDLRAFIDAQRMTRQNVAILWDLARGEPVQQPFVTDLAHLIDKRFAIADATTATRRKTGFASARERVLAGQGSPQMVGTLAKIDAARAKELDLLDTRARAQQADTTRALNGISVMAVLSMIALIAVALWLLPTFDSVKR